MSDRRRPDKPIGPKEQIVADTPLGDEGTEKISLLDDIDRHTVFPKVTVPDEPDAGRVHPKVEFASETDADTVAPKMHLDIRSDDGAVGEMLLDRLDDVDDQKLDGLDFDGIVSPRDPASGLPTGRLLDHDGAGAVADHNEVIEGVFKFAVPIDDHGGTDAAHLGDAGSGANWEIEHAWPAKIEMDGAPDAPDHTYEEIVFTLDADAPDSYQAMPELDASANDGLGAVDDLGDDDGFDALDG